MSDDTQAPIDTGAEVSVPEGEVTHEQLVQILEDSRKAEAAPVEPEKPAPPPAEKVSARIIASRKAEIRQAEERRAIAAERQAVEADRKASTEAKAQADAFAAAKMSPSKALELLGMSPKEFLESLATEHEPEAVTKRAMAGTQTELQKLAAELASLKSERQAERNARALADLNREVDTNAAAFVEEVADNAAKYPALCETWTPDQFVAEGLKALDTVVAKDASGLPVTRLQAYMRDSGGEPPANEEIADLLEKLAQPAYQKRNAWRERLGKSAPVPSQGVHVTQGQPVMAAKPRTLTNGHSAVNASAPKGELTEAETRAESIRLIEQLHASRGAT